MPNNRDPAALTADLIRCPSVTPCESGALVLLEWLPGQAHGDSTRVDLGEVHKLKANQTRSLMDYLA